jgi:heat-inducible transcriptional repressor
MEQSRGVLTDRERAVLSLTVLHHISTGEPAGSRAIAKRLGMDLSPATIRNTMADLEEKGYLRQTHVSSGRVPTDAAYRLYVDELLGGGPRPAGPLDVIGERLRTCRAELAGLIRETSRTLSSVSRHVGVVLGPQLLAARVQHLEFRRVAERKVLAIFVSESGLVQTQLLEMGEDWSQEELDAMGRLWNERFSCLPLREVRERLVAIMAAEKAEFDALLEAALELGGQALAGVDAGEDLYLDGAANILEVPELATPEKMRALVRAIEEKSRLCRLLDRCLRAEGVQIFIGGELPLPGLQDLSLITAPYRRAGQVVGVLGVIGPTRMEYARIIPIVEYTASSLSACLSGG